MTALMQVVEWWAGLYNDHTVIKTTVACVHVGGMLLAGGLAIAADRTTLRAMRAAGEARVFALAELGSVHRLVLIGLAMTVVSGVLMFAADLDVLLVSPVMWLKMGLFVLLLVNGLVMQKAERALTLAPQSSGSWARLRFCAVASLALWFGVALSGTALLNVS